MTRFTKVSTSTTLVLCGLAVGAITAGGIAQAANSSATPTPAASAAPAPGGQDHHGGPRGGGPSRSWGLGGPDGAVLHGEYVVSDPASTGKYLTEETQTGVLTASSATSATIRSADGYVQIWLVNATTKIRTSTGRPAPAGSTSTAPSATITDLTVGSTVLASGVKNVDGSVTAGRLGVPRARPAGNRPAPQDGEGAPEGPPPAGATGPAPNPAASAPATPTT